MAFRPNEVYRGKHKRRNIIMIVLSVVAALVIGAVLMFYSFQKYLVYGPDGVSLELPILATPEPTDGSGNATGFAPVDAEVVVVDPDYSAIKAVAGENVGEMRALFVPAEKINDAGIAAYVALLETYGANALVFEVKPESGQLAYASSVPTATSYGLSGAYDLAAAITTLKENNKDLYFAAMVSCCIDNQLATRNAFIALRNAYGGVFTDANGMWLDPYNTTVREYISGLALELSQMGFDEVILKNAAHPVTDEALVYSETMSFAPTPRSGVSGLAMNVTNTMRDSGTAVSAVLSTDTLHSGLADKTGQDAELFFKVFDRVCCWADSAWQYGMDKDALASYITLGDAAKRYLPIMTYAPDGATSWIVKVPDDMLGG